MLAEYYKEKDGCEVIENEAGFLAFVVTGKQFYIAELYIKPEFRKFEGKGLEIFKIAQDTAKERGCEIFGCHVTLNQLNLNERLMTYMRWGFRLNGNVDPGNKLVLLMPVGEWNV